MAEAAITDDDLDRLIADPTLIQTHEQVLEVLEALDDEIANIQSQVDAAQIEANVRPLSPDRQGWVRRASYACAMKRNERHKVMQRDRELRNSKLVELANPEKRQANLLKQQRLVDDAVIRKTTKQAEVLKLQNQQAELAQKRREFQAQQNSRWERKFVTAAKGYLDTDTFEKISQIAHQPKTETE